MGKKLSNLSTLDEIMENFDSYSKTNRYKFDQFIYRMRRIIYSPLRWKKNVKHWYQRARYGYSDRDCWNGDWYVAGIIAGIMERIVTDGHGVAMSYAYGLDEFNPDVDIMVQRRDEEWNKYAAIFREYSKNGPAWCQEWADDFGGVLDSDMKDALEWLSKHFQELWD